MQRAVTSLLAIVLVAAGVTACNLDDRALLLGPPGAGGAGGRDGGKGSATGGKSGGGSDAGPGDGGNSNADAGLLDGGCPDCSPTNIVYNPDFDTDADGWDQEPDGLVAWDTLDAAALDWSGSISVENTHVEDLDGQTAVRAIQCATAVPGMTYELAAKVQITIDQGSGSGHLNVKFYEGDSCDGPPLSGGFTTSSGSRINDWENDHGETIAPDKAASVAVRLVATKPLRDPALKVVFDEIRVIEK
jgi:hypothetical protein